MTYHEEIALPLERSLPNPLPMGEGENMDECQLYFVSISAKIFLSEGL